MDPNYPRSHPTLFSSAQTTTAPRVAKNTHHQCNTLTYFLAIAQIALVFPATEQQLLHARSIPNITKKACITTASSRRIQTSCATWRRDGEVEEKERERKPAWRAHTSFFLSPTFVSAAEQSQEPKPAAASVPFRHAIGMRARASSPRVRGKGSCCSAEMRFLERRSPPHVCVHVRMCARVWVLGKFEKCTGSLEIFAGGIRARGSPWDWRPRWIWRL